MSDYGAMNCTASEREQLRDQLHSYCMEGGYCRKTPPNKLYCQCLPGWKNDICDTPDFLGANFNMVVIIPVAILVFIFIGVVIFLVKYQKLSCFRFRDPQWQSGYQLGHRVWNCETGTTRNH